MKQKIKAPKTSLPVKIGTIVIIGLLLLIPRNMIKELIHERQQRQTDAIYDVSSKWGYEQTITGPVLAIPYTETTYIGQEKEKRYRKVIRGTKYLYVLPEELKITGDLRPQKRHRGIYEIAVYNSNLKIEGRFDKLNFDELGIPRRNMLFDRAVLLLGISDLRGIQNQVKVQWDNKTLSFNPGTVTKDVIASGVNTSVPMMANDSTPGVPHNFTINLNLNGSQKLFFVPVGKTTDIKLTSNWPNPSFKGAFLPDNQEVSKDGFKAHWNVLHLNRNFPQQWTGPTKELNRWDFGVNLLIPVDHYQKSLRAVKYAILFIVLTFMVFFFVEVTRKVFIHPVQYILVGSALIIFFTLLVSISEQTNFNFAYIISALATLALVTAYVKSILKSNQLAGLIGGILAILYTFIFIIIQLQDYALLIGSIGLFIILALVMYFSRKIDWYNLYNEDNQDSKELTEEKQS